MKDEETNIGRCPAIPDSCYIYDGGSGELGGTFFRDDDCNGRPSWRRERDDGEIVVIRWHVDLHLEKMKQ